MKSQVYFMDFRSTEKENLLQKLARLVHAAGIRDTFRARDLVAVKVHFGGPGNTSTVRPVYLRQIVHIIRETGGIPFLTDTTTLSEISPPGRGDAPSHLQIAVENGFAYPVVDAPIVIADGLRGLSEVVVTIDQKRFEAVSIAAEIANADALISVAHFKLHEGAGFGGALKNLAIGCATRGAKLRQHSARPPKIIAEKCTACGRCVAHCPSGALTIVDNTVVRDADRCNMCAICYGDCPDRAFDIVWISSEEDPYFYHETKMEHALGALKGKEGRAFFVNFINHVSPNCDCYWHNDAPIIRDVGVVASQDPVAIDQASLDLMNQEPGLPGTALKTNTAPGQDKVRGVYPYSKHEIQLAYAQEISLGFRDYELIEI
ncbi:MAG: DUF362 domain-containing protein [Anaerolineae bacterium]